MMHRIDASIERDLRNIRIALKNPNLDSSLKTRITEVTNALEKDYRQNLEIPLRGTEVDNDAIYGPYEELLSKVRKALVETSRDLNNVEKEKALQTAIEELNAFKQGTLYRLAAAKAGRDISIYFTYVGSAVKGFGKAADWIQTIGKFLDFTWLHFLGQLSTVVNNAGAIFPPIIYAYHALAGLFDLAFKILQLTVSEKSGEERLKEYKEFFGAVARIAAAAIGFIFNTLAVVAFAVGVTTTPMGLAFAAVAVTAGWIGDTVIPMFKKGQELAKCEKKIVEIEKSLKGKTNQIEIADLSNELVALQKKQRDLARQYADKKSDSTWGAVGVASVVLFALSVLTGPVGLVFLAGGGLLLAANIVRSTYVWNRNRQFNAQRLAAEKLEEQSKVATKTKTKTKTEPTLIPSPNILKTIEQRAAVAPEPQALKNEPRTDAIRTDIIKTDTVKTDTNIPLTTPLTSQKATLFATSTNKDDKINKDKEREIIPTHKDIKGKTG